MSFLRLVLTNFIVFGVSTSLVSSYDFTNIPKSVVQNAQVPITATTPSNEGADSILYNVSSLGLVDPFSNYSTHLTYDSKVVIDDPHNNQKGSILTLLNGTVYPLGSVGAIGAIGWEGNSNDTDVNTGEKSSQNSPISAKKSVNGGMSGIWLAFTSKDALTGGYTLNNETLTTSNNVLYQNLTFLSNFTIHQDGTYTFKYSFSALPGQDGKSHFEAPHCTQNADKKDDPTYSMTCTGKRKIS